MFYVLPLDVLSEKIQGGYIGFQFHNVVLEELSAFAKFIVLFNNIKIRNRMGLFGKVENMSEFD